MIIQPLNEEEKNRIEEDMLSGNRLRRFLKAKKESEASIKDNDLSIGINI